MFNIQKTSLQDVLIICFNIYEEVSGYCMHVSIYATSHNSQVGIMMLFIYYQLNVRYEKRLEKLTYRTVLSDTQRLVATFTLRVLMHIYLSNNLIILYTLLTLPISII